MKSSEYTVYVVPKARPDQLHGYPEADLRLLFRIYAKCRFSHDMTQITSHCAVIINLWM